MTKHFIAVGIVDHKLVRMPHIQKVNGVADQPAFAPGIGPIRGLAIAAILSGSLWIALLAMIR